MQSSKKEYQKISSHEIFDHENLDVLNTILAKQGFRIEKDTAFGGYQSHMVYQGDELVFETIYPKELLIKVAQLLPDSDVRLGRYEVYVGDHDMSQETLNLILK